MFSFRLEFTANRLAFVFLTGSEQLLRIKCEDLKNTTGNELDEPTDLNSKRKHISSKAHTADDYIPPRIVATAYLNTGTARDAKTDTSAVINESSVTGPDKEHAIEMGTFTVRQFTAIESDTSNSIAVRESITEPVSLKKSTVVFDSNENYAEYCSALQQSNPLTAPKLYNSTSRSETKQSAMPNVEKGKRFCIKGSLPLGKTDTKMFPEPASELKTEKSAEEKAVVQTLTQVKVKGKRKENNEGFFCDICNWTFKRKITYDNHLLNDKCILRCGMCPKVFPYRNKSTFKTHLRVHNKQFDYKCEGCGRQFVGKYNFLRHQQTFHNKDKPHNYDICFKTFPSESDLILHKSTNHSVEGKCPCPQCTKVFQQPLPLREHLKFKHLIGEDRLLA